MENEETASWITESLQGVIERMFGLLISSGSGAPLEREYGSNQLVVDQGVLQLQNVFNPLILFLATLGILLAAVRLLWTRRLDPMMDLVRGLLTVIITTFAGLFFVYVLSGFSSGLTQMILDTGTYSAPYDNGNGSRQVSFLVAAQEVYPSIMRVGVGDNDLGFAEDSAREAVTYLVSLAVILGLIAQMIVLAMLKSIVYLLSCLLPLAAASSLVPGLKIFPKVIGWLFACLLYKPLLLLVYLSGLVLIATTDADAEGGLSRYLLGAAVMLMATGALPVLMKLMSSGSVWMMALAAGGISSVGGGGGGSGSGADASPSSASGSSSSSGSAPSADGGAQAAAAAGANERAAAVSRNLDEGGGGQPPGGGSSAVAASAAGTGAVDTGAMGTQGGLGAGAGGPLGGTGGADGTASVDGALGGPEGGGAQDGGGTAAAGATESVGSTTVSGSEQGYSQTVASGAGGDGGSDPGAVGDAPAGAGAADTGAVSGGASGGAPGGGYPGGAAAVSPEGASGAQFADGADGRMV
ncbi:hypothetical protein ACIRPH_17270 [Nocardiopsis sp. NPDC101807]|uniref:hypothetical protein n=1 Tax=Nocardiopsis sp. NPDC101807 TaxID=3364339 RepID=UPI0038294293